MSPFGSSLTAAGRSDLECQNCGLRFSIDQSGVTAAFRQTIALEAERREQIERYFADSG